MSKQPEPRPCTLPSTARQRPSRRGGLATIAALAGIFLLSGVTPAEETQLPRGPGRDLVYGKCRTCHSLQSAKDSAGITRHQWDGVLDDMESYGLDVSPAERKTLLEYLATYLGPNPPAADKTASTPQQKPINGRDTFLEQCSACHQADGQGLPGEFPPLAGNPDLFRAHDFPIVVLLNGLEGPIEVNGKSFNGQMPSFRYLPDEKVAALVRYIRTAWGNDAARPEDMAAVTPKDVAAVRAKALDPDGVHAYRKAQGGN